MKTRHLLILMTAAVAMFVVTLAPAKMCPNTGQQQISATFDATAPATAQISQTAMTNDTGQTYQYVAKETEPAYAHEDDMAFVAINKKTMIVGAAMSWRQENTVARIICHTVAHQNGIRGA